MQIVDANTTKNGIQILRYVLPRHRLAEGPRRDSALVVPGAPVYYRSRRVGSFDWLPGVEITGGVKRCPIGDILDVINAGAAWAELADVDSPVICWED